MSIASGGVIGKRPGMSTHRSDLPEAERDYAYAFLIEEWGMLGGLFVLMLYMWLFFRCIEIFKNCKTAFPTLLILGLGAMITLQALLHMAVSVGLLPVFGQQLPLISRGGSSLIFTLIALGMILGVSRQTTAKTP
jgi:cell division protein FtsW